MADGVTTTVCIDGFTGTTGDCGEAACVRSTGKLADCNRVKAALESGGLRIAERPKYQKTKAPCNSARTINSQTMDTSTPCGTGIQPTRLSAPMPRSSRTTAAAANEERGAVGAQRGSLTVVSKVVVPERMPENLPAQPQQYLARSRLGAWHDSQNFVIRVYGIGMNFVMTTSKLITSQKAAKSNAHAGAGTMRVCLAGDAVSPEFLAA